MKTDKTKLLQDIEAMKEKLASMEEELNKPDNYKHFPSEGDKYYYYTHMGAVCSNTAANDDLKVNTYNTWEETKKACDKAVALEKVKRRIIELQGDWKPDWGNGDEKKIHIIYNHFVDGFEPEVVYLSQRFRDFPYIKNKDIAELIICKMDDELKLIFGIA